MHHFQKLKISGCRGGGERVERFFGNLADVLSRRLVGGRATADRTSNPPFQGETPDRLSMTRGNFGSCGKEPLPLNERRVGFVSTVVGTLC
jgi:hypothetical protein